MNHTELDLERTLAYHGAPAMAGIKSADLIAWGSPEACSTPLFRQYQRQLAQRGIQLRVIWTGRPRCLLLVYRPDRLERQLNDPAVRALLLRGGLPGPGRPGGHAGDPRPPSESGGLPPRGGPLSGLSPRGRGGLPPPPGRDYKLSGCWKVYSDVERARQCFRRYGLCRAALCRRLREGKALAQCSGWRKFVCDRPPLRRLQISTFQSDIIWRLYKMSNLVVIYWSMTGNTQAMAEAIAGGAREAGPRRTCSPWTRSPWTRPWSTTSWPWAAPPWGPRCWRRPSFEPFFTALEGRLGGKRVALFGSYGWGDGQWMRDWKARADGATPWSIRTRA